MKLHHLEFQVPKKEESWTLNKAILRGGGVFLYISLTNTAYIGEDSSILGTWNVGW